MPTKRPNNPVDLHVPDQAINRNQNSLRRRVAEIERSPAAERTVRKQVELPDATNVPVAHGLGRVAACLISPPRGAISTGRIVEIRTAGLDLNRFTTLRATGFGATITVDVLFL